MATDSATLDRRQTPRRRSPPPDAPEIASPAAPIARGIGLDQPFFDDKNRAFWILQSIGWIGYFFLRSLSGFANSMGWMWLVHTLLLTATGYSLTLLMASLFRRLIKMQPIWTLVLGLIAVGIAATSFSIIETWSYATFLKPDAKPAGVEYLGAILLNFSLLAAWSALYFGINYFLLLEEQIDQRERLENAASSAQLAMLRYQLNPHFLFNTLNSISTLVLLKQTERANAMLARLSSFLRYTLVNEPTAKVTLAQEVETLKLYLEIEKMQFEDRLRPHFRIESETIGARLPSLLLQPLIENAIKYAVTPSENGADIWITATREAQAVRIEVSDNGSGEGSEFAAESVDRSRTGEHSRQTVAGLWRGASFREQKEREGGLQRYCRNSLRDRRYRLMTIRTILVDDEPLATQGLQLRLQAHDDVEIVATAANGREAIRQIKTHKPDLVFLDIQMPGFDGFSVIQGLMDIEPPLFVFVTAYSEHALRAFDAQAVDYLMKPVDEDRLAATMDRVRQRLAERRGAEETERLKEALAEHAPEAAEELAESAPDSAPAANRYEKMINIKDQGQIFRVDVDTIERIDAAGDYMCIQTGDNTLILRETMKDLEKRLDPRRFQRVHRSTIVNLDLVRQVKPHTNGECFLVLDSGAQVKVSRSYRDVVARFVH